MDKEYVVMIFTVQEALGEDEDDYLLFDCPGQVGSSPNTNSISS
jgi:hypothetical protein